MSLLHWIGQVLLIAALIYGATWLRQYAMPTAPALIDKLLWVVGLVLILLLTLHAFGVQTPVLTVR